jgi:hypothetical protein
MLSHLSRRAMLGVGVSLLLLLSACTQDAQNEIGRSIQDWTGTNGVLDVYAGDKLVRRFIKIDKLTTPRDTVSNQLRPYRFSYGYVDTNLNYVVDPDEKKVYFEIGAEGTNYVFYENFN